MIRCDLRRVAGSEWNISKLSRATNRSVNVIRSLWNDTSETYNRGVLNDICRVLKCSPGDLIILVVDAPVEKS